MKAAAYRHTTLFEQHFKNILTPDGQSESFHGSQALGAQGMNNHYTILLNSLEVGIPRQKQSPTIIQDLVYVHLLKLWLSYVDYVSLVLAEEDFRY